jgi:uncharacterized protein YeaO (DUF488 family)
MLWALLITNPGDLRSVFAGPLSRNFVPMLKLKRVYEKPSKEDGFRILVERLWPRGLTKDRAGVDLWLKEVAPSPELRKWYSHDPAKWEEFRRRYEKELEKKTNEIDLLLDKCREGTVTLVYAAHDEEHNSALLLKQHLEQDHPKRSHPR